MKRMIILALVLVIAAGTLMAGGGRDTAAPVRENRDRLVVATAAMARNLDPALSNDMPSARIHNQIYDTLVVADYDMSILPSLAERWVFDSPTALRMFLRRDIRFHNNDVLTARDVQFTLERAAVSPEIAHITGMIRNVQVVNDHEVVINLQYPYAPFLSNLAHTASSIVNQRALTAMGETAHSLNPVGTGPYRVTNVVTGDRIELTRWDGYHGTPAIIRDVVVRVIPDPPTRLLELETGGIDIYWELHVAPQDIPRAQAHPHINVMSGPALSLTYIGFNTLNPPLNDMRVRQAIIYALDLDAINRVAYAGLGSTGQAPLNPTVWGSAAGRLPPYQFNQARARQLLAEAGHPNGFATTIFVNENQARIDTAEIMQGMLAQVGIRAEVRIVEWGAYLDMTSRRDGGHTMFILGWNTVTGDPDYGLYSLFHSSMHGAPGNRMFYTNAQVDRLLDAGRQETNPARREQIYFEAQQIIHREAPWISQWNAENVHGLRSDVRGYRLHPNGRERLWLLSFE